MTLNILNQKILPYFAEGLLYAKETQNSCRTFIYCFQNIKVNQNQKIRELSSIS